MGCGYGGDLEGSPSEMKGPDRYNKCSRADHRIPSRMPKMT
jgi:hypothetical protein